MIFSIPQLEILNWRVLRTTWNSQLELWYRSTSFCTLLLKLFNFINWYLWGRKTWWSRWYYFHCHWHPCFFWFRSMELLIMIKYENGQNSIHTSFYFIDLNMQFFYISLWHMVWNLTSWQPFMLHLHYITTLFIKHFILVKWGKLSKIKPSCSWVKTIIFSRVGQDGHLRLCLASQWLHVCPPLMHFLFPLLFKVLYLEWICYLPTIQHPNTVCKARLLRPLIKVNEH